MKKYFALAVSLLSCVFFFNSCQEPQDTPDAGPAVLSVQIKNKMTVYEVPKSQTKALELYVNANPTSPETYTSITLAADESLVASYNTKFGTDYKMLPSSAYSLATTSLQLIRYNASSNSCELKLKGEGCEIDEVYVLPVKIDEVVGGNNFSAPDDKAAYILFKMTPASAQGSGTQADPYKLSSVDEFILISNLLKEGETTYFSLEADIDFSTYNTEENVWEPINTNVETPIFFEGNSHKISNINYADAGIFKRLVGTVQNLTIDGMTVVEDQNDNLGILANVGGQTNEISETQYEILASATVKNVTILNSKVNNASFTTGDKNRRRGGLIGFLLSGSVENCNVACEVYATNRSGSFIGYAENCTIDNCSASGNITVSQYYGGGFVGIAENVTITNCFATGNVTTETGNYDHSGGFIGQLLNGTLEKCYATGNVKGTGHFGGGLVGEIWSDSIISKCYATGNVTLNPNPDKNFSHAGGLIGSIGNEGVVVNVDISNCYSTGAIVNKRYSAGLLGSTYVGIAKVTMTNCYTTSDISGIVTFPDRCGLIFGANSGKDGESVTCIGCIAWNPNGNAPFCYPDGYISTSGNYYGAEGTVSSQAKKLGWDESIWDLSNDLPTLK